MKDKQIESLHWPREARRMGVAARRTGISVRTRKEAKESEVKARSEWERRGRDRGRERGWKLCLLETK